MAASKTAGQMIQRAENVWLIRIFLGRDPTTGKRLYRNVTIHGNKNDAQKGLNAELLKRDLGQTGATVKVTVGELLDMLLNDYKINGKRYEWAEQKVRLYLRPAFGKLRASKLSTPMLQSYVAKRLDGGAAVATVNRDLSLLRRAFNLGYKATPRLVAEVPNFPLIRENNVRKGFFEHEEYRRVRDALPPDLKPVLAFAYYTGARRGEILALRWDQVDLIEGTVRLNPGETKNDEPRLIPLAPELLQMMKIQRANRDQNFPASPWVFSRNGEPITYFEASWRTACREAGLWAGDEKTGKPTRLFHDLRRTGVRNLIRAGVPERIAMTISGHKTRSVFDRYNVVSESDLKQAASRLSAYLQQRDSDHDDREKQEADRHTSGTQSQSWHTIGTQGQKEGSEEPPKIGRKLLI